MVESETITFNGIKFRRYPNSDNMADRRYYRPNASKIGNGIEALHREVWKHHNGEIPDDCHIHHVDGDPTNNDIDNLECVTPEEHAARHPENNLTAEDIRAGMEAAKEWHKSEEGSEWHSEHWEESIGNLFEEPKTKDCEQCGDVFEHYTYARFCSNACKAKHRRESGVDDEVRECEACRQDFTVNKYRNTKTCSRACAGALVSWSNRVK